MGWGDWPIDSCTALVECPWTRGGGGGGVVWQELQIFLLPGGFRPWGNNNNNNNNNKRGDGWSEGELCMYVCMCVLNKGGTEGKGIH